MKRRINLLSINFTKRELSEVFGSFRLKAFILMVVLILGGIAEFGIHLYIQNQIKTFELSKNTLEQYIDTNQDFEDKLKFFFYKYGLLQTYLKEDANGYVFYTQVQELLSETAPTAVLEDFSYKNNGETNFTLHFVSYDEAASFIRMLETPIFLDVFQYVELQGFDAAETASTKGYSISISAQFITEDET